MWCKTCDLPIHRATGRGHTDSCTGDSASVSTAVHSAAHPETVPDIDYTFEVPGRPVAYKRVGGEFTDDQGRTFRAKPADYRAYQRRGA
jgi:hypothetical protein